MIVFSVLGKKFYKPFRSPNNRKVSLYKRRKNFSDPNLPIFYSYPDVMMPAYAKNRWSSLFFIAFLVIHLYFLMNLMLAVVYETFTRIEKQKFRKLLLHRRRACQNSFKLLVAKNSPTKITFKHFQGLIKYYKSRATKLDAYLMFKTLDVNKSGNITLDEFYKVYDVTELKWKRLHPDTPWYIYLGPGILAKMFGLIHDIVVHQYFEGLVYAMISLSGVYQIVEAATLPNFTPEADIQYLESSWPTLVFVCCK